MVFYLNVKAELQKEIDVGWYGQSVSLLTPICVLITYRQKNGHADTDIRDIKVSNLPSLSFKFTSAPLDI